MADQTFNHSAEIMKAAMPYIDSKTRGMAELFTKLFDLMGSLSVMKSPNQMAACGYGNEKIDIEGLLNGIRPYCNLKEKALVDKILSIFNAKRMFEMYNNFMSTMKTMQEAGGFSFGDFDTGDSSSPFSGDFSGFNFDSIFKGNDIFTNQEAKEEQDSTIPPQSEEPEIQSRAQDKEPDPSTTSSGFSNNQMLDMLKAMVPPEQRTTFENLSMLFNTMSYNGNSKPENDKEQTDG